MADVLELTWDNVDFLLDCLSDELRRKSTKYDTIIALGRGGLIPAVMISHELGLPYVIHPGKNTLVVDDINDTGHTLSKAPGVYHAVLHHKPTSKFKPNFYAKEVGEEWLVYPWEREDSEALPDYLKQVEHLTDSHYIGGLSMPKKFK